MSIFLCVCVALLAGMVLVQWNRIRQMVKEMREQAKLSVEATEILKGHEKVLENHAAVISSHLQGSLTPQIPWIIGHG